MKKKKNTDLRVEYRIYKVGNNFIVYSADTEELCVQWIENHTPADLMGDVSYIIQKVWTTSRRREDHNSED